MHFCPPEDKGVTIVFVSRTNTEDKGVTIPRTKLGPLKGTKASKPNLFINGYNSDYIASTTNRFGLMLTCFGNKDAI